MSLTWGIKWKVMIYESLNIYHYHIYCNFIKHLICQQLILLGQILLLDILTILHLKIKLLWISIMGCGSHIFELEQMQQLCYSNLSFGNPFVSQVYKPKDFLKLTYWSRLLWKSPRENSIFYRYFLYKSMLILMLLCWKALCKWIWNNKNVFQRYPIFKSWLNLSLKNIILSYHV